MEGGGSGRGSEVSRSAVGMWGRSGSGWCFESPASERNGVCGGWGAAANSWTPEGLQGVDAWYMGRSSTSVGRPTRWQRLVTF